MTILNHIYSYVQNHLLAFLQNPVCYNQVPILTSTTEEAQARVTSGMGMVLGGVVILLTLIWGLTVVLGSSDPDEDATIDTSEPETATGAGNFPIS